MQDIGGTGENIQLEDLSDIGRAVLFNVLPCLSVNIGLGSLHLQVLSIIITKLSFYSWQHFLNRLLQNGHNISSINSSAGIAECYLKSGCPVAWPDPNAISGERSCTQDP